MTEVIGQAWIEVLGKTAGFGPQVKQELTSSRAQRQAAEAGDRFGTAIGQKIVSAITPYASKSADDFGREFSRKAKNHGAGFGKLLTAGIGAGVGIASADAVFGKIFQGIEGSIGAASDLAESTSKNAAVFRESAGIVEAYAGDQTKALLLTKQAALEAASTFGNLFVAMGSGREQAATLSTDMVTLAQDLKSFSNVPVEEALLALQAGVLGEAEPLRRFGVALSEARVQSEALAIGLVKPAQDSDKLRAAQVKVAAATANLTKVQREHGVGTLAAAQARARLDAASQSLAEATKGELRPLTELEKIQSRVSIIMKDTASAHGDAARTIDEQAGSYSRLKVQLGNVAAQLGEQLLPYTIDATHALSGLVAEMQAGTGTGGDLKAILSGLGDAAHFAADAIDKAQFAYHGLEYGAHTLQRGILDVAGVGAAGVDKVFGTQWNDSVNSAITKTKELQQSVIDATRPRTQTIDIVLKQTNEDPKYHAPGFIGPTIAEGPKFIGPIRPRQTGAEQVAQQQKAAGEALHATQVRIRDSAKAAADASIFAADQLAAYQERQRAAFEAAQDAIRARSELVQQSLERQGDALQRQVDVITAAGDKIRDFRAEVFGGTQSFTALTSLAADPSKATAAGLIGSLQARVKAEELFGKNLTVLGNRGLDKGVLGELAKAGPEQRALASALAQASPSQIAALNAAEKASRAQAQQLAATTTAQQFGAGALERNSRLLAQILAEQRKNNALQAALPKQLQQALKNHEVSVKSKQRTAVGR